jgi:hypothetical protein
MRLKRQLESAIAHNVTQFFEINDQLAERHATVITTKRRTAPLDSQGK